MSNLETLDVGQAQELKLAFRRTGWSNRELKQICEGDFLIEARKLLHGEVTTRATDLLLPQVSTDVSAVKSFSARKYFRMGESRQAGVPIGGYVTDDFRKVFFEKDDKDVPTNTLTGFTVKRNTNHISILAELGQRAETRLAYIWELLSKQPHGESGILLNSERYNFFYVRDLNREKMAGLNLWVVEVNWLHGYGGWRIETYPVGTIRDVEVDQPSFGYERRIFAGS